VVLVRHSLTVQLKIRFGRRASLALGTGVLMVSFFPFLFICLPFIFFGFVWREFIRQRFAPN